MEKYLPVNWLSNDKCLMTILLSQLYFPAGFGSLINSL